MWSLRRALSDRFLASGMALALDRRKMIDSYVRAGDRSFSNADLQVLSAVAVWSSVAIRVGMWLMPRRPPEVICPDLSG